MFLCVLDNSFAALVVAVLLLFIRVGGKTQVVACITSTSVC